MMDIGKKVKELRHENNLTQQKMAQKIHIAQNTLSQIENNIANPSYDVLISISNLFQCSTDYLLGREDDLGNVVIQGETNAPLSPDEQELLNIYQSLSPAHRSQILEYARYFAEKSGSTRRKA